MSWLPSDCRTTLEAALAGEWRSTMARSKGSAAPSSCVKPARGDIFGENFEGQADGGKEQAARTQRRGPCHSPEREDAALRLPRRPPRASPAGRSRLGVHPEEIAGPSRLPASLQLTAAIRALRALRGFVPDALGGPAERRAQSPRARRAPASPAAVSGAGRQRNAVQGAHTGRVGLWGSLTTGLRRSRHSRASRSSSEGQGGIDITWLHTTAVAESRRRAPLPADRLRVSLRPADAGGWLLCRRAALEHPAPFLYGVPRCRPPVAKRLRGGSRGCSLRADVA